MKAELTRWLDLVVKTEERKDAFRAVRDHKSTVQATETLRILRSDIAARRKDLEALVMSCPFCLWNCANLFSDAETDENPDHTRASKP